jgi:predicted MFS family arabinose efflux permease
VSTSESLAAQPQQRLPAATRATYIAFIACGVPIASWASRIAQVRDRLQLSSADLGLVLLSIAAGSIAALVLAGVIVTRYHSRRTVTVMAVLHGVAVVGLAVGYLVGVVPVVAALILFGFSAGAWDVAMNVQGAAVERKLGRAIMPRFHAGFSIGTVAGALVGAAMVALHVPVTVHLAVVGIGVAVVVPLAVRSFIPDTDAPDPASGVPAVTGGAASALRRWREPRTLLVGLVVLAFAFAEGAGIDWINLSLIDGYGQSAVIGTLGFAAFLTAMTVGRWFGDDLLSRYGRVAVIRGQALLAIAGVLVFVFSPGTAVAFVGVLMWGLGASLGFPVGMSAAADEPAAAAGRVSVVASIGYCAFLAGPPLVGYLGEHVTVLRALIALAVVVGLATLATGALRPLQPAQTTGPDAATR